MLTMLTVIFTNFELSVAQWKNTGGGFLFLSK